MRTLTALLVSAATVLDPAQPSLAQLRSVGVQSGIVQSTQVRGRAPDSNSRRGPLLGVFVDPQTPLSWMSVLAELSWVQRRASYDAAVPATTGALDATQLQVRTDYLTFTVAPTARVSVGRVSLFGYAGPSTDILIRSRTSQELRTVLERASDQVLAAAAGGGLELRLPGGQMVRSEVRMNWGLSAAYSGSDGDVRYRSLEILVRLGRFPLPR
jgi:hypothetical protein